MMRSFIGPGPGRLYGRIAGLLRSPSTAPTYTIYSAIFGSIIAIAVIDILTPLSLDEWLLFFIPLVISFTSYEPILPIGTAIAATIALVAASAVSPPGFDVRIELINRGMGGVVLWAIAGVGYIFIRNKLRLRRANEELQAEMKLRAETQALAQAQRMEAVAQLTGGLAHDINNMLTVVTGNIERAIRRIEDDEVRQFLARARQGVNMGAKLNRQLLTFARQRKLDPVKFNLNQHVTDISELLERSLGEKTTLSMELASEPSTVMVDPGEVDNALLNLAINSRDAMPGGGSLRIETHDVTLDAGTAAGIPDAHAGEFVCLSVSDSGQGMAPEVLRRAVEPFFTTKEPDQGTGLGLSSVYGFARQSGGFLDIKSEIGKGTSVSIFLPRAA
jgi:signal transduction histidine kinase